MTELATAIAENSPESLAAYKDLYLNQQQVGITEGLSFEFATMYPMGDAGGRLDGSGRVDQHGTTSPTSRRRRARHVRGTELLPKLSISTDEFWAALQTLVDEFSERNLALLEERQRLQSLIDAWHRDHGQGTPEAYRAFLESIGYLVPQGPSFTVSTDEVDPRSPQSLARNSSCPSPTLVMQ